MELRQLAYFKVIAETENMSVASHRLHVSQPFLSRTIKALEEELGLLLFDRQGKKIILNSNGQTLYRYAARILQLYDDAIMELQKNKETPPKTLTLAMLNTTKLFPELIAKFCEEFPYVNFSITRFTSIQKIPDECNMVIHASNFLASTTNSIPLFQEECLLGMSRSHRLARVKEITPDMLEDETFLLLTQENTLGELTRRYFEPLHFHPRVPIQCDSQQTLTAFVEEGMGLAFFPCLTWKVANEQILLRKIKGHTLKRTIYLSMMDENPADAAIIFKDYITTAFQQLRKENPEPN